MQRDAAALEPIEDAGRHGHQIAWPPQQWLFPPPPFGPACVEIVERLQLFSEAVSFEPLDPRLLPPSATAAQGCGPEQDSSSRPARSCGRS